MPIAVTTVQEVPFGSALQQSSVVLRDRVLRKPLGLVFTPEELAREANEMHVVATDGEVVVGVLLLRPHGTERVQMRQVAVDEACQGTGVGRQLVMTAETIARKKGFSRIVLHARAPAVPFYEKLGYACEGAAFMEVGIEHRLMAKDL